MDRTAMIIFSSLFFGSLPIWGVLAIVQVVSTSSSVGKPIGVFGILLLIGLLGMVGGLILDSFQAHQRGSEER